MAKKPKALQALSFVDIVMRAEADVIKAAYEARVKIDDLLVQRDEAYQRIFEIENQIEEVVGEQGVYVFPVPPCPIAGQNKQVPATRSLPKPTPAVAPVAESEEADAAADKAEQVETVEDPAKTAEEEVVEAGDDESSVGEKDTGKAEDASSAV